MIDVPVEDIQIGDRVTLRNGRGVTVTGISSDDEGIIVRWQAGPILRGPHKLAGEREQIGSFAIRRPGETVSVDAIEHGGLVAV